MTFLFGCFLFGALGVGTVGIYLRHRRKTREIELRHEREITNSLERALRD